MADTRVISSRDLARQEAIQYIRAQTLQLTLIDARPNTKMYIFFGTDNVTHLCFPKASSWTASTQYALNSYIKHNGRYYQVTTAGTSGTSEPTHVTGSSNNGSLSLLVVPQVDIITDNLGQAVIELNIPGGTYSSGGSTEIVITDTPDLEQTEILGNTYGTAKGYFNSFGTIEYYQSKEVTITTVTRTQNIQQDPLAQSFFTYGVTGGLFVSSIEVYFNTKDTSIPVRCELRTMENGYPSKLSPNKLNNVSILTPDEITVSNDASVPSKFVFNPPIYLPEDGDYCFVLRSNSNNYNVFTSRMGEESIEDGRKIYDNPFIGSLFKSENNITWTAEQFEDIKFKINKAVFSTSTGTLNFDVVVPALAAYGNKFSTTSGSNVITYRHNQEHGLEVGSKILVATRTDDSYVGALFNGISYEEFNGEHTVTNVINRNAVQFQVTSNATSTGDLENATIVTHVFVLTEGINYSSSDTITFTGGGGTGAAGTLQVVDGKIKSVIITDPGSGYTSSPSITINTSTGSGANLQASTSVGMTVIVNKPMTGFTPIIPLLNYGTSSTTNTLKTTIGNYEGGNLVTYSSGKTIEFNVNTPTINIDQSSLVASSYNEEALMSGNRSAQITIEMNTDNPNVSPVLDLSVHPMLRVLYNRINNQPNDTIGSLNSSGSVSTISMTANGTNYTADPVVSISAPDYSWGVQATAHATRSGTAVTTITVDEPGSGYISTPIVTITRGSGDTTGAGAAAQAVLTQFNTELLPTGGTAKARYITKRNSLQILSTGIRLYAVLASMNGASVDWYIRTSLSSSNVNHEEQNWQLLSCDTPRTKSSYPGQLFEYEFKLDDIDQYDTYDLKCVMTAQDPTKSPILASYRVIVLA